MAQTRNLAPHEHVRGFLSSASRRDRRRAGQGSVSTLCVLLRQQIRSGTYGENGRLPDETDLANEFGVSRTALRAVLALLAEEGLVERRRGRGTFVSNHQITHRHESSSGLLRSLAAKSLMGQHQVISTSTWPMDPVTAGLFGAPVETPMHIIERVTRIEEEPIQLSTYVVRGDWAPTMLAPALVQASLDMKLWLRQASTVKIEKIDWIVDAVNADTSTAETLQCDEGAALLRRNRYFRTTENILLAHGAMHTRGDRFAYEATNEDHSDTVLKERLG